MLLFSSPFRARTAEASARSNSPLLRFATAPPKYLFRTIRERIQREGTGASFEFQRCFCSKKDTRPPPESLRNYSKTIPPPRCESEKTSIARRGIPGKRDAISIHRAQSSRSPHDRPYCIGVRASAYINKRSVHRGVSRGTKYNIVLSDRPP